MSNPFEAALAVCKRNTDMASLHERQKNILRFVRTFYPEAELDQVLTCPLTSWEEAMQYGTNKAIPGGHGLMLKYWVSEEHRKDGSVYYKLNEYWGYKDSEVNVQQQSRKFV